MYVYQAYDGNGNELNGYLWFDCSNGRWTRSVVGAGDSACPYQWACTGPYPTGTIIDPVWSSCPYSGAQTCSASSPPPPPPSPPYFTVTSGPCTVDPNSRNCIRSPNYPSSYLNSQTCIITPTSLAIGLQLTATAFSTEAIYDYLSIPSYESGTMTDFSGTIGPSNFVLGPGSILWITDGSVTYTGWRVCSYPYPSPSPPPPPPPPPPSPSPPPPPSLACVTPWCASSYCPSAGSSTSCNGVFYRCCTSTATLCRADTTCPPSPPPPPLSPPSSTVPGTYFTVTSASGSCTVDPSSPNCILSGGWPSNYWNGQACTITPTALAIGAPLTATSFNTESCCDYLRIPSHPSGTLTAFYGGSGPSNFVLGPGSIQWTTDGSVVSYGWRVCSLPRFASSPQGLSDGPPSDDSWIIGVSVGVPIFLVLAIGLSVGGLLVCRKRKANRAMIGHALEVTSVAKATFPAAAMNTVPATTPVFGVDGKPVDDKI